jgi:pimeloyl-ACP methyl ester carboxylesterase
MANDPRSFAALSRTYRRIDLEPLYERVQCPALIIGCTGDPIKPAAECRALADRLHRGGYREVDSAHYVGLVSPRLLIDAVREFFDVNQERVEG